jgi:phosphoenolpyruvate synthase/pyruvate phosphate dikinase
MSTPTIIELGTGPADPTQLGGKASALHRLAWLGFPIPRGFTVTPEADDDASLLEAFDRLGARLVAVRSSALAEDGAANSFAGQHDTYLNVPREDVAARVAACRRSAHNARAREYREQQGIDASFAMPVLVQTMLAADVAGVCFTRHPTDPDPRRCLIEAVWGLGESLVSGTATPDTYVVDRDSGAVSCRQAVQLTRLVVPQTGNGLVEVPVARHLQTRTKLSASQIDAVRRLGLQLETHHGYPCDIEFALVRGNVHVLQCRPITA